MPVWTVEEAFAQPENPDPAIDLTPPTPGVEPYDSSILQGVLTLGSAVLALSGFASVLTAGTLLSFATTLLATTQLGANAAESNNSDAAARAHLEDLQSWLTGMQHNVDWLKSIDPVRQAETYKQALISVNAVFLQALPHFQQAPYRRVAMRLFVAAAGIHLGILRNLFDMIRDGSTTWSDALRGNAAAYAAWLQGTRQAIIDQRLSEVGPLEGSGVVYIKDSFRDHRLRDGNGYSIFVAPASDAAQNRAAYVTRRAQIFSASSWMAQIDQSILAWKQIAKLCNPGNPALFAPVPDGAAMPGIGSGGSYVDVADKIGWEGPTALKLLKNGRWTALAVPAAGTGSAFIDIAGSADAPSFSVRTTNVFPPDPRLDPSTW